MPAVALLEVPEDSRLIRCRGCGQVLAIRTPGGRRVRIITPTSEQDETGRIDIDCPVCGKRRRIPKEGDAA